MSLINQQLYWYINSRCIKPNNGHQPDIFDDNLVGEQLRYNGLAEVAKIRKMGFAVRRSFGEFVHR